MPVVAPVDFQRVHSIRDCEVRRVDESRQPTVMGTSTQLVARAAAIELDRENDVTARVEPLEQGDIVPSRHGDRVWIEIEAGSVARLGSGGIIPDQHIDLIGEGCLQSIAALQRSDGTHTQPAAIIRICTPG